MSFLDSWMQQRNCGSNASFNDDIIAGIYQIRDELDVILNRIREDIDNRLRAVWNAIGAVYNRILNPIVVRTNAIVDYLSGVDNRVSSSLNQRVTTIGSSINDFTTSRNLSLSNSLPTGNRFSSPQRGLTNPQDNSSSPEIVVSDNQIAPLPQLSNTSAIAVLASNPLPIPSSPLPSNSSQDQSRSIQLPIGASSPVQTVPSGSNVNITVKVENETQNRMDMGKDSQEGQSSRETTTIQKETKEKIIERQSTSQECVVDNDIDLLTTECGLRQYSLLLSKLGLGTPQKYLSEVAKGSESSSYNDEEEKREIVT